jgi:hypothetical protein
MKPVRSYALLPLCTQQLRHELEVQYGVSDDEDADMLKGSEVLENESVAAD